MQEDSSVSHQIQRILGFVALILASACQMPGPSPQAPADNRSLSDVVIDDYFAQVQGSSITRSVAALSSSVDSTSFKRRIHDYVSAHSVATSTHINEVLPVVMAAITANAAAVVPAGDKAAEAALIGAAFKSTTASLKKHVTTLPPTVVVATVVAAVVQEGTTQLATVAAVDPVAAGLVLQSAVGDISNNLTGVAGSTAEGVLKVVITSSVATLNDHSSTALLGDTFLGLAKVTTDTTLVASVVKSVLVDAKAASATLNCTDALKAVVAALPAVKDKVDDVCAELAKNGTTVSDSDKSAVVAVATEAEPTATLSATADTAAITGDLTYKSSYNIALSFDGSSGADFDLTTPNGHSTPSAKGVVNFTVNGSGTFVCVLKVSNHGGFKTKTVVLVIRVIAKPTEATPVAVLKVTEGGTAVSGSLPWVATGHSLVLDATQSTTGETDGLSYELSSNTGIAVHQDSAGVFSVTQSSIGSVTYTLRVTNVHGLKSAETSQTITIVGSASDSVKAGLAYLKQAKYDEARASFATAILKDSNDNDARIWSSLLDLAALTTDPSVVSLMGRLGVQSYPSSMNDLFSKSWLKGLYYDSTAKIVAGTTSTQSSVVRGNLVPLESGETDASYTLVTAMKYGSSSNGTWSYTQKFVPDAAGSVYASSWSVDSISTSADDYLAAHPSVVGYHLAYSMLDELSTPQLFPLIKPAVSFTALDSSKAPSGYTMSDWSRMVMINLMVNCLGQANAEIDALLAGPWGANFDAALARLASVSDTYRTIVPSELISSTPQSLPEISLGKPELLALSAHLQATKAMVQYLDSVSFTITIPSAIIAAEAANEPWIDANNDGVEDHNAIIYAQIPGFRTGTLLTDRNNGQRAASKATFLAALGSLNQAVDLVNTALGDSTSVYAKTYVPLVGSLLHGLDATAIGNTLTTASTALGRLKTAIQSGGTVKIPSAWTTNPMAIVGASYDWSKIDDGTEPSIEANPAQLWAENNLDLRKWLTKDSSGFTLARSTQWEDGSYTKSTELTKVVTMPDTPTRADLGIPDAATVTYLQERYGYLLNSSQLAKFVPSYPGPTGVWYPMYTWTSSGSNLSSFALDSKELNSLNALHTWFNK